MRERCGILRSQDELTTLERELSGRTGACRGRWGAVEDTDRLLDYRNLLEVSLLICRASLARDANAGVFFKRGNPPAHLGRSYNLAAQRGTIRRSERRRPASI